MKRPTCGIAFLGDFWHARGSLKVQYRRRFLFFSPRFRAAEARGPSGFGQSWRKDVAISLGLHWEVFYVKFRSLFCRLFGVSGAFN